MLIMSNSICSPGITFACAILVALLGCDVTAQSCPDGFTKHSQTCYKVQFINATWIHAPVLCEAIGAKLITIDSPETQAFIHGLVDQLDVSGQLTPDEFWLNASDLEEHGVYRWVDKDLKLAYSHWGSTEPNNQFGNEDCVEMRTRRLNRHWNDNQCFSLRNFICETSLT